MKTSEIIYRGISIFRKCWVTGNLARVGIDSVYGITPPYKRNKEKNTFELTKDDWDFVPEETVGMITPFVDSRGYDIYEGDILKLYDDRVEQKGKYYVVRYLEGSFVLQRTEDDTQYVTIEMSRLLYGKHSLIMGNKWDNPELYNDVFFGERQTDTPDALIDEVRKEEANDGAGSGNKR